MYISYASTYSNAICSISTQLLNLSIYQYSSLDPQTTLTITMGIIAGLTDIQDSKNPKLNNENLNFRITESTIQVITALSADHISRLVFML